VLNEKKVSLRRQMFSSVGKEDIKGSYSKEERRGREEKETKRVGPFHVDSSGESGLRIRSTSCPGGSNGRVGT
jgi:hypothetical protein